VSRAFLDGALREVVAEARRKDPLAQAVAIQASEWSGKPTIALNDEQLPVHWCRSVLELRQRLAETGDRPVVLLTDRDERELGEDVLAFLARGRLLTVGLWEPVKAHFRAKVVPRSVTRMEWLPEALMRHQPAAGYAPAPNAVLTEEHAVGCLCEQLFGARSPTVIDVLRSVADPLRSTTLASEPDPVLTAIGGYLASGLGDVAELLLAAVPAGHASHAVAIGLAADVVFRCDERVSAEAAVRLERYVGGRRVTGAAGQAWAEAATRLIGEADSALARTWTRDAEKLLTELGVEEQASLSDVLPSGLLARLGHTVATLSNWLKNAGPAPRSEALASIERVGNHRDASPEQLAALRMAARLIQFVHSPQGPQPESLLETATQHLVEGGPLDLAREALDRKEVPDSLDRLYRELADVVDKRRDARARRFAELLASATVADQADGLIPVERILHDVVVPVARTSRALLVVLDGMAEATFRSVAASIERTGWRQVAPVKTQRPPALAALPSVTRVSRTSLLSGQLTSGGQHEEARGFEETLRALGESRLFHKGDIAASTALREALGDNRVRVVGVVVNAIDDRLEKGEQIQVRWTLDTIAPLRALLDAAADGGRAVVLASDHGHVLERASKYEPHPDGGARWRPASGGSPDDGEVLLRGRRVREADGQIVAAAIERLRYQPRRSGYHGGATPQEVVAPVAVYLPVGVDLEGFEDAVEDLPAWWEIADKSVIEAEPLIAGPGGAAPPTSGQERLFGIASPARPDWIERLLTSETYRAQRERAHRPPDDGRVAAAISELEQHGWIVPERALAAALGIAPIRVRPLVASLQQLLNVDGYRVLALDAGTGDVRLDRPLLGTQFGL
jgi:hypothetical protein